MKKLVVGLVLLLLGSFALAPSSASADVLNRGNICAEGSASSSAVCVNKNDTKDTSTPITSLIGKITKIVGIVAGILAVIMIIISGIRFVFSGGDSQKVTGAKNMLVGSVVGLVIIALAGFIISFVMSKL